MKPLPVLTSLLRAFRSALVVASMLLSALTGRAGTWTQLRDAAPGNVELMLLLPDGTVMAQQGGISSNWYRLTPDTHGSYIDGTWSTLAPMNYTRQYYSSAVLRDGRVFVAGGEYPTNAVANRGGNTAELYNPLSNNWTVVPVPPGLICTNCGSPLDPGFSDSGCILLPDGKVLIAPVQPVTQNGTVIFDPVSNTFSNGPAYLVYQNEATWVKLPDDSILTIDPSSNSNYLNSSERFIPSLNNGLGGWIVDQTLPVPMYNAATEIGAGLLLPDGRALFIGGNGQTAYYTPTGNTSKGSWTVGPTLVSPGTGWDEPAAMMVNGKVLFQTVLGPPQDPQPRGFYELDPNLYYPIGTITETAEWGDNSGTSHIMLNLPDGNVLVSYGSSTIRVYQPDGAPVTAGKPAITSITPNADGTYHLTGTRLNGNSQGSSFGDDAQMDSNYPLVRLIADSGEVTYARTFNWSSTGVQTGNAEVSTEFALPAVINGTGVIWVEAVANGIASDPFLLPLVLPEAVLTFSGNASMGGGRYEIRGGITTLVDDGSASGSLLRRDGGTIQLLDTATAETATISVRGGMGNGGRPGHLLFHDNSTAAGADIVNHPGVLGPNFKNLFPSSVDGFGGETIFYDTAVAGAAHITNEGEANGNITTLTTGGITDFRENSSADQGIFVNQGAVANNGQGGLVEFEGSATADHGTFVNNSGVGTDYSNGRTVFFETSTAGTGIFTNHGSMFQGARGGATEFRGGSTADHATFINEGGTTGGFNSQGGVVRFFETATASNAIFVNLPSPHTGQGGGSGGGVEFHGNSTAGNGIFTSDSRNSSDSQGGSVMFTDDATAAYGQITNIGYPGGYITFLLRSSADNSTIVLEPNVNANASRLEFHGTSTAGDSTINIGANGCVMQFYDGSTAGNAAITVSGNAGFNNSSTAGNAAITVTGSSSTGGNGNLGFVSPATAGQATITAGGASVTGNGTSGGIVSFDYGSSAGTATLTANGGSNGGSGGRILFGRGGNGSQARVTIHAGGSLEVGGNVLFGGTPIGSIEGDGAVLLGQALMTVGSLNSDTTFAGVIGSTPNGGTVTKVGAGSLALSGTNTYTGLTTVAGGTLAVNGALTGPVQVNGGATLKGSGSIAGAVTVLPGGIVSPGNSPGTLTIGGDYIQSSQGILEMEVAGPNPQNQDHLIVNSNINLSGKLLLVFSGYAPSATDSFTLLQAGGSLIVSNLEIVVLGLKPGYQPTYQVSAGKLILTATSSGQLRTFEDPAQTLSPWFAPQSGFVYPVFTVAGATYHFDTSTDLKTWTPISQVPGANVLVEFRNIPSSADSYRFYRIVQINGSP